MRDESKRKRGTMRTFVTFKGSRHIFVVGDVPQVATKMYVGFCEPADWFHTVAFGSIC